MYSIADWVPVFAGLQVHSRPAHVLAVAKKSLVRSVLLYTVNGEELFQYLVGLSA